MQKLQLMHRAATQRLVIWHVFGRFDLSEKLSEIKPPLVDQFLPLLVVPFRALKNYIQEFAYLSNLVSPWLVFGGQECKS